MSDIHSKIGFTALLSIVIGSQIGSGVFMLPSELAIYGYYNIIGWITTGLVAIMLASTFGLLSHTIPKTGGPHAFAYAAFGRNIAFYTGWTYWIISWISSTAVIVTAIEYLMPVIGSNSNELATTLQISLVSLVMLINLRGIQAAGFSEIILTILKCIPLLIIPIIALFNFNFDYLQIQAPVSDQSFASIMSKLTLLMIWGFVGVECATAPAGSTHNPKRNIPLAIITGTGIVAAIYLLNSIAIMGMIPTDTLSHLSSPYVSISQQLFGGNWHLLIALITSIVCMGTLNAWVLTSGQIALGLAEDGLLPQRFQELNRFEAPRLGLIVSCMGTIPFLLFLDASHIRYIVEYSGIAFLLIYLISSLSLLKLKRHSAWYYKALASASALFCFVMLISHGFESSLIACLFIITGMPVKWFLDRHH